MTKFKKAYIPQSEVDAMTKVLIEKPPEFFERFIGPNPTATQITEFINRTIQYSRDGEVWKNDLYQVAIFEADLRDPSWPKMWHLSIKRIDRAPIHDWRDLQQIKNEIVGPLHEGVELYPSESRLLDSANQYHLFVLADESECFPFGIFHSRIVTDEALGKSVNRKLTS